MGGERVEGDAGAYDARIGSGRVAAADRRRERRLEAELACGDGAEEDQVVRRPARRVEAHLPLHDLCLPAEPEPLRRADVRTQARAMHRPRRRHVNGTRPEAGRAVAEVQVLAIEEVARVEAAELPEQVAAHCHERAVHPVHPAMPAPGTRPSVSTRVCTAPGRTRASGLRKHSTSPRAAAAPRLAPPAKPRFSPVSTMRAQGWRARARVVLPSVESLSTSTTSRPASPSAARLSRQPSSAAPAFQLTTTIDTVTTRRGHGAPPRSE